MLVCALLFCALLKLRWLRCALPNELRLLERTAALAFALGEVLWGRNCGLSLFWKAAVWLFCLASAVRLR